MSALTAADVWRDNVVKGDIHSGANEPDKADVRRWGLGVETRIGAGVARRTAELLATVVPAADSYPLGAVTLDPDPTKNGFWTWSGSAWQFDRPFPDTMAVLTSVGGTANAITASSPAAVDPAEVIVYILQPTASNTAAVTLSLDGAGAKPVLDFGGISLAPGAIVSGQITMLVDNGDEYRLLLPALAVALFDHKGDYNNGTVYSEGQAVTGSDNHWYQLKAASALGDNPVGSATGNWLDIGMFAVPAGSIGNSQLATGSVDNPKLADDAVDARAIDQAASGDIRAKLGIQVEDRGDLLARMMAGAAIRGMYLRKTGGGFTVGVGMAKGLNSVCEYGFAYDDDDFLSLRGVTSGTEDVQQQAIQPTLSGTFVTTSAPSTYTATLNDTLSAAFTGTNLYFDHVADDRGGVWEFTLKNGPVCGRSVRVSTYNTTLVTRKRSVVYQDLPYGTYAVVAKFLGDDPYNAPSGGTSRGWVYYEAGVAANRALHYSKVKVPDLTALVPTVSSSSINEFAISARPNSAAVDTEWVPEHGSVSGVMENLSLRVLADGELVTDVAGDLPSDFTFRECQKIEFLQSFDAINPNGGTAMWTHHISHTFDVREGFVRIRNRLKVLQDTFVSAGYLALMGATRVTLPSTDRMTRLVYSNGVEFDPLPATDSETDLASDMMSAMYAGVFNPSSGADIWHGCAVRVSSLQEASSRGKRIEPAAAGFQTVRASDGVAKTYWKFADNTVLLAGEVYTCEHAIAARCGIKGPNDMLRMV